jgi:hypothetical protein
MGVIIKTVGDHLEAGRISSCWCPRYNQAR